MAETAVGLFQNAAIAEVVVHALGAHGVAKEGIRVLAEPAVAAVGNATSTPRIDFEAALARDLRAMGATEYECESYVDAVSRGNVLVFVTGSTELANDAADLMSEHAIAVEEFAGVAPVLPSTSNEPVGNLNPRRQAGEERVRREGVRLFAW
jgi:hypothetical protein